MAKIMTARYPGTCATCGGAIQAGTPILWDGRPRHFNQEGCRAADRERAARAAALCSNPSEANRFAPMAGSAFRGPQAAEVDLTPIRAFIQAARDRGLKHPKLRVLAADGRTELTLGLTVQGHNPGSVSVCRNGQYLGLIRPDGTRRGSIDDAMAMHLLAVAADPAAAAKRYAVLKCRCSFCGLELTDAGSVEVGYGPVCARHWGLPHAPKGTPAPVAVSAFSADVQALMQAMDATGTLAAEADERAMQALEAAGDRAQTASETHHTMMEVA